MYSPFPSLPQLPWADNWMFIMYTLKILIVIFHVILIKIKVLI